MSKPTQPSDFYCAFTWPRLIILARILFDTRKWVADDAKPERGDSLCGVGFRAWEQTKHAVMKAAAYEHKDWLSVTDGGANFTFKLHMMPIRFLRADAEEPLPPNYGIPDAMELREAELAFDEAGQPFEGIFRLVCEADGRGQPLAVHLVLANGGETLMTWEIPLSLDDTGVTPLVVPKKPVELPPLQVETQEEAAEREQREAEAENERLERQKAERDHNTDKGA
jgi:hypothetical protein